MKTGQELHAEHLERIKTAIALEKPDRIPIVLMADAFCARYTGMKMADFIMDPVLSNKAMVQTVTSFGDVDGIEMVATYGPLFKVIWNSKIRLPGRELPEDALWQLDENELMTVEDYDAIINKGYNNFLFEFYRDRLDNAMGDLQFYLSCLPQAIKNTMDAGLVAYAPINTTPPIDVLCGARSMAKFTRDLYKIPDKVQAVMDAVLVDLIEGVRQAIRLVKPLTVFLGSGRGASEFLSPKLWERFVWPYLKKMAEVIIEEGVVAHLHLDSCWDRDLEYFRELPKGKCVWGTDSATNIFKLKNVLGDHMCIMGDVPPALLTLGTPDEVFSYTTRLINEIGPSGYILSQGCTIPPNAKVENVKAMISAVLDK